MKSNLTIDERLDLIEGSGWPIAWDGCHKLYFLQDKEREAEAVATGYDIYPSTEIRRLFENSCGLRFISRWGNDNYDFRHDWNIHQFEYEEGPFKFSARGPNSGEFETFDGYDTIGEAEDGMDRMREAGYTNFEGPVHEGEDFEEEE